MTDLTVGMQADPTGTVITVAGEMDLRSAPRLRQAISEALATGPGSPTVDLAELTFCDSMGISTLVVGRHRADNCQVGYRVVNARGMVASTLGLTGVLDYLNGALDQAHESAPVDGGAVAATGEDQ